MPCLLFELSLRTDVREVRRLDVLNITAIKLDCSRTVCIFPRINTKTYFARILISRIVHLTLHPYDLKPGWPECDYQVSLEWPTEERNTASKLTSNNDAYFQHPAPSDHGSFDQSALMSHLTDGNSTASRKDDMQGKWLGI